jgi:hypothetical protein
MVRHFYLIDEDNERFFFIMIPMGIHCGIPALTMNINRQF